MIWKVLYVTCLLDDENVVWVHLKVLLSSLTSFVPWNDEARWLGFLQELYCQKPCLLEVESQFIIHLLDNKKIRTTSTFTGASAAWWFGVKFSGVGTQQLLWVWRRCPLVRTKFPKSRNLLSFPSFPLWNGQTELKTSISFFNYQLISENISHSH